MEEDKVAHGRYNSGRTSCVDEEKGAEEPALGNTTSAKRCSDSESSFFIVLVCDKLNLKPKEKKHI